MNRPEGLSWRRAAIALLAGCAQAASLAWPFEALSSPSPLWGMGAGQPVWWLQLLALGLLARLLDQSRRQVGGARLAAMYGWLFASAWLTASFWWTFVAMHTYGGLPAILAALAVLALAGLLAMFYAAACGAFAVLAIENRAISSIIFAALWLMAELARGTWMTGFGWGAVGYAHVDGVLAGFAPWLGAYGLCALAAWLAMTLVLWLGRPNWRDRLTVLALTGLVLSLPAAYRIFTPDMTSSSGRLGVALLQGNIAQDEKFEAGSGVPQALRWYAEQLQGSRASLVIAPETAIPVLPQQLPTEYWEALQTRFAKGQQAALIGTPLGNYEQGYTNSVVGLKPGLAQPWRYDKHHLVPFGEFIPPMFRWFTEMMNIPLGDFNRGALVQAPFEWQGQRLSPNICYEDLFGEELGPYFGDSALAPTVFVNISNLAWFGKGLALDQHLQIARMRAKEFARPFLMATNTGVTAIVDHRGLVAATMPRDTRGVLVGEVEGRRGVTPYAWWVSRLGLWPFWIAALGLVLVVTRRALRKRQVAVGLPP